MNSVLETVFSSIEREDFALWIYIESATTLLSINIRAAYTVHCQESLVPKLSGYQEVAPDW